MNQGGTTLLELVCVLTLLSVGTSLLLPVARRHADELTVRGAREQLIGLVRQGRASARLYGESRVLLEEGANPVLTTGPSVGTRSLDLTGRGVILEVSGRRSVVALRFGPLGIARWGSATFVLRRGEAEAPVVVSSYGRVRR